MSNNLYVSVGHQLWLEPDEYNKLSTDGELELSITVNKGDCYTRGDICDIMEVSYHIPTGRVIIAVITAAYTDADGSFKIRIAKQK